MTAIAASDISISIVKEWQSYDPVNKAGEHVRHVVFDATIGTGTNKDYPADGIPLSNLFDSADADYIGIDQNHVWYAAVEGGMLYDGANEAVAVGFPAAYDRSAAKLIVRTLDAAGGGGAQDGLDEGAKTGLTAGSSMTFRMYMFGRKDDL